MSVERPPNRRKATTRTKRVIRVVVSVVVRIDVAIAVALAIGVPTLLTTIQP